MFTPHVLTSLSSSTVVAQSFVSSLFMSFALSLFSSTVFADTLVTTEDLCPSKTGASIVGIAKQVDNGEFLYCEYHYLQNQQLTVLNSVQSMGDAVIVTVEYRDKSQALLAVKKADFSADRLSPNVEQIDNRHGEKVSIQRGKSQNKMDVIMITYFPPNTDTAKTAEVDASSMTVADAGFDNAVRTYWQDIIVEKKVIVDFVAPVQQTTVNLSIKSRDIKRCNSLSDSVQYNAAEHLCITAQAANVILNWFVKPIILVYERQSKRLVAFSGAVNLSDNNGDAQSATILYRYQ